MQATYRWTLAGGMGLAITLILHFVLTHAVAGAILGAWK